MAKRCRDPKPILFRVKQRWHIMHIESNRGKIPLQQCCSHNGQQDAEANAVDFEAQAAR